MKRTVLLDGDTVIYAACSAAEVEIEWEWDLWTLHGNPSTAFEAIDSSIERIRDDLGADHVVVALSCDQHERWRPQVMPDYKANRTKSRKPLGYRAAREYVIENYDTYLRPTLEGDDVLGILATHPKLYPGEKIVCAIDKDLRTVPGKLYNYDTKELTEISEYEADRFFMKQTLMGDATDGYSGCPGIGPKTAEKILDKAEEEIVTALGGDPKVYRFTAEDDYWPYVVAAYEKKGLSEEVALMNARVARICRAEDYNFEKKEVILWTPT